MKTKNTIPPARLLALAVACWVPGIAVAQEVPAQPPPVAETREAPIQGGTAVLQRVIIPGRVPATPLPPPQVSEPETVRTVRPPLASAFLSHQTILLSATVYDHRRTLLRWQTGGSPCRPCSAWSNIDSPISPAPDASTRAVGVSCC